MIVIILSEISLSSSFAKSCVQVCGTGVVATIFKLSPGARVLPHTGTSNRRLVLQFALQGADGVRFRVGDEWRSYAGEGFRKEEKPVEGNSAKGRSGDGKAVVFDDSFEHEVAHAGPEDRYVLYAVLYHPEVYPPL